MSRLAWVDVFASGPMTGNPLAVVLDAAGWPASRMQALAAELGISETTFVLPAEADGDHRVRIFTPRRELPVAGHPLVGTAWVLRAAGRIGETARLETVAGTLAVRVQGSVATTELGAPEAGALVDAEEAGRAAGAPAADHPPAQVWSVGVPQLMLPVADLEALAAARPDDEAIAALGERDGWLGVSLYCVTGDEGGRVSVRVRHFAPRLGVPEDPVTGSAAAALGACLAAAGMGDARGNLEMVVGQGIDGGRGGEVAVRVRPRGQAPALVRIGGRVVPLFEGRFVDP
jgi:trans-2,3-dihydro-3-hydroxyanthranilate isomerase